MTITVSRAVDPLTGRNGFSAKCNNDCAFSFSQIEAAAKLLSRLRCAVTVEWVNGSTTLFAPHWKGGA